MSELPSIPEYREELIMPTVDGPAEATAFDGMTYETVIAGPSDSVLDVQPYPRDDSDIPSDVPLRYDFDRGAWEAEPQIFDHSAPLELWSSEDAPEPVSDSLDGLLIKETLRPGLFQSDKFIQIRPILMSEPAKPAQLPERTPAPLDRPDPHMDRNAREAAADE